MRPHPLVLVIALASLAGFAFASFSTYDFASHLDRQVHGIHCSFLPGVVAPDASGASGCHVTLMSPYSSVLRDSLWGGIPISLPGMSVFAFLLFWLTRLVVGKRQEDPGATGYLLLATGLPLLMTVVMGYLALVTLDAACKLCIGIYLASVVAFVGALLLWLRARKTAAIPAGDTEPDGRAAPFTLAAFGVATAVGVLFVVVPAVAYAVAMPDFEKYSEGCGSLPQGDDPHRLLVPIGSQRGAVPVVEVVDPLCPACKGFEERFDGLVGEGEVSRRALLFPLDNTCNWMVDHAIHPGACAVSEAILCADSRAEAVLDWAFANQEAIRASAATNPEAASHAVLAQFPELRDCVGKPGVRAKLNRSLRWAVQNQLPVLTPQVYVGGTRLCDADTDLGLDYVLRRMLNRAHAAGRASAP